MQQRTFSCVPSHMFGGAVFVTAPPAFQTLNHVHSSIREHRSPAPTPSQRHPFTACVAQNRPRPNHARAQDRMHLPAPNHSQLSTTRLPPSPSQASPPSHCPPYCQRPSGTWSPGAGTAAPSPATTAAFARSWPAASRAVRRRSPWTGGWCASACVMGTWSSLVRVWGAFRVKTEELA